MLTFGMSEPKREKKRKEEICQSSLYVYPVFFLSVSVSLCLRVSISLSMSLLSLSLCVSVLSFCVNVSLSLCLYSQSLSLSICVNTLGLSLSLSSRTWIEVDAVSVLGQELIERLFLERFGSQQNVLNLKVALRDSHSESTLGEAMTSW